MSDPVRGTLQPPFVVAVDQGTGSTKAIALDSAGAMVASAAVPVGQTHPRPGWVEQSGTDIAASVDTALARIGMTLDQLTEDGARKVAAVGLSTQRESAVLWDRLTGEPLGPVLGWQDRRTRDRAQQLMDDGRGDQVAAITGLPIDPMFSALKFEWLLDAVDPSRERSKSGRVAAGTIDSWLVYRLTGEHRVEAGNASRTQLLDLDAVAWSDELLSLFNVPRPVLPEVMRSNVPTAPLAGPHPFAPGCTISAVLADSHAALFAHGATSPGDVKVTYGTGSSIMGLSSSRGIPAGLVRTLAWHTGEPEYAFEGNILSTGATLMWLADFLGVSPGEVAVLAERAPSDHGVELVPAFAGLGAPWWDEHAQGIITGLTLGTDRAAVARAAVESIVLQIEDVLDAVETDDRLTVRRVFADGGPTMNPWLMELQADLSQRQILRSDVAELSALGAAHLAGVGAGLWSNDDLDGLPRSRTTFRPGIPPQAAVERRRSWLDAVARSRSRATTSRVPTAG